MRYIRQWTTGKKASALHRAFEKLQITEQAQQADSKGAAEKGAQQPNKQKTGKDGEKAGEESERDKVGEAASKRLVGIQSRGKPKKEKNQQIGGSNLVDGGKELGLVGQEEGGGRGGLEGEEGSRAGDKDEGAGQ